MFGRDKFSPSQSVRKQGEGKANKAGSKKKAFPGGKHHLMNAILSLVLRPFSSPPSDAKPTATSPTDGAMAQHIQLQNGVPDDENFDEYNRDNLLAWEEMAGNWETNQVTQPNDGGKSTKSTVQPSSDIKNDDGNDMFTQCLLPRVEELAEWKEGETVLDLGAGNGILGRMFARKGADVTGLDFSEKMMRRGRERDKREGLERLITYDLCDLMNFEQMRDYMDKRVAEGKECVHHLKKIYWDADEGLANSTLSHAVRL